MVTLMRNLGGFKLFCRSTWLVTIGILAFLMVSCGGGGASSGGGGSTPSTITAVSVSCTPTSVQVGQTSQCTATVSGTGSYSSSVTWSATGGTATSSGLFTSSSVGASVVTATSSQDSTKSGSATVTVTPSNNPVPTVTSLSPASVSAGASAQTLAINGTGFLSSSTVTFNSSAHTATYVSATQLTILLSTTDLATAGSFPVVVTNPQPGGGSSTAVAFTVTAVNPVPAITSLSPATLAAGAAAQTLTINGTGFLSSSSVTYNSVAHTATYVSASQLTISLSTSDLATAGSYPVVVTNPAPGGGSSAAVAFTVSVSHPIPVVTSLSPASLPAGAASQTLAINGTGFLSTSTVSYNGVAHSATYVSASQLTISLSTSDLATTGSYPVIVTNPPPGGGASAAVNFTVSVSNPVPAISTLSPASLTAGSATQTLTINGSGFIATSSVTYNGIAHAATFVSTSQLTVSLTASDLATAGSYPLVVTNPAPGGGSSAAVNFTVNAQGSVTISPSSASVQTFHRQQFTATVNGNPSGAVTWLVNATAGGNLTAGQIDSTGLYVAPNQQPTPSSVTVTATSQSDSTQSASVTVSILPDAAPPAITSVLPAPDQTNVLLNSSIQIQFSDLLDPSTVTNTTFTLASAGGSEVPISVAYDPTSYAVTITPQGILSPGGQYTVSVSNTVADPAGESIASPFSWSFTTQPVTSANGIISTTLVSDPTQLTVVSYGGQQATPDASGNFSASVIPLGSSLVAAMIPGKNFGWMAFATDLSTAASQTAVKTARQHLSTTLALAHSRPVVVTHFQITSSAFAAINPTAITTDATTTAESLLFLTPYFYTSDPSLSATIQMAIAQDPTIPALAAALQSAQTQSNPISDAAVQAALQASVKSIYATLTSGASSSSGNSPDQLSSGRTELNRANRGASPNAIVQDSTSGLVESATPYCMDAGTNIISSTNSLQCLDLNYVRVTPAGTSNGQFNTTISTNNCGHYNLANPDSIFGCAVDWLVIVGPNDGSWSPSGGVNSITATQGSLGPASPLGNFDPQCTQSTPAGCAAILQMQGSSIFSSLDLVGDLSQGMFIGLGLQAPAETSFLVPGNSGNYVVRAYSGGIGDFTELANVLGDNYGSDSRWLWLRALGNNIGHTALQLIEPIADVLSGGDTSDTSDNAKIIKCLFGQVGGAAQWVDDLSQYQDSDLDSAIGIQIVIQHTVGSIVDQFAAAAPECIGKNPLNALFAIGGALGDFFSKADPIVTAFQAGASVGTSAQRIGQLISASPVETAIISVNSNNSTYTHPLVTSVTPSPIVAVSGTQSATILGSGFAPDATVYWQTPGGTNMGPFVPVSAATPSTVSMTNNFGNQTGTWKVQVFNQSAASYSPWFTFQVSASTTAKPDLVPQNVAISSSSVAAGNTVTVSFLVLNQGSGSALASTTGFRLGSSPVTQPSSAGDIPNSLISTPQIASGKSVQQSQTLTLPSSTPAGTYYIWVVVDDVVSSSLGQSNTANDYASSPALTVTVSQSQAPTITAVSPNPVPGSNTAQTLLINGSNFVSGATLTFHDTLGNSYLRSPSFVSASQLSYQFNNANDAGPWTVTVTNPGGQPSNLFGFTVSASTTAPTVTSISPTAMAADNLQHTLTINGTNFQSGDYVQFYWTQGAGAGLWNTGNAPTIVGATQLTVSMNPGMVSDTISVRVCNASNTCTSGAQSIAVTAAVLTPTVTSISPTSMAADNQQHTLTINGTNFQSGDYVQFKWTQGSGAGVWNTGNLPTIVSSTQITVSMNPGTVTDTISVRVCNSASTCTSGTQSVAVTAAVLTPTVTSISPTTMTADNLQHTLTINGTNFQSGDTVQFYWTQGSGAGVWNTGNTPTIVSSTQITVSMNPGTVTDTISVRVCNSASTCTAGTQSVAVTAAVLTPTVTSISPTTMTANGVNQTLTINGTNFQSGDYVQFYWTQGSGAGAWNTGNTPTIVSSTQITVSMNPGTVTDTISVRVCNSASSCTSGTQSVAVTAAVLTPTVTSISPTTMTANGVSQTLTINGTNFQSGDTVQFKWTQGTGAGVWNTGNTPTIVSSTQITVSMNPGTVTDTISVRVCNSASTCTSGTQSVAVTTAVLTPTVTSISPTSMTADNLLHTLTINGTNFQSGDYVQFYWTQGTGAGVWNTGNSPTIVSSTQITVSMNPGTVTDTISVRVCNSASTCTSGTQSVAVTAAVLTPTVTSISPTTMTADNLQHTLTINGTNFQSGDTVQFYWTQGTGAGLWNTGNAPTIVSATQLTVSMNPGTVTDTISVRVCNSASTCTAGTQSVAVTAAILTPTVTSISPTTMTANGVSQTLTINGTNFQSGDTVQFKWTQGTGAGVWNAGNTPTIVSTTQITVSMNPGTVTDTISVRVCNSASACTAGTQSVAVTAAVLTPTVTSILPTTMTADNLQHTLTINGTNFQSGDTVQFKWTQGTGAGVWNAGNTPTIVSTTQITVSMNPGTVTDTISVRVCNSASSCTSGTQSVAVTAAVLTPTVTSISPTTMTANGVSQTLTINGTNFQSGDTVQFYWTQGTGAGVWNTGSTPTIVSSTQITVSMNPGTVTDTISVRVCNSASSCTSGTQSVAVTAAVLTPTVTSISPTTMTANGVNQTLTINGTNFQSGDTVQFKWTQGTGAGVWNTGNTPTIVSSTQITVSMNPGTVTDTISVRVCNSASTCTAGTQSVAVTAAVLTPTVTSISPTTMTANGVNQTLTINGTNFQSGDYVQFYWTQGSGAGAWNTGNSPTIVSSTQITVSMNPGTVTDTISVRVCNSASACTAGTQSVAVTAAVLTPTVTSISPTTMTANGVSQTLTINGTNFQSGDTVQFYWTQSTGAGVWNAGNTPTIVSSTQITVSMNPGTVTDTISVRVCNSASTCTSGTQSVAVTAAVLTPTVTSISPTTMTADNLQHTLTINGTNFQSGDTVQFYWTQGSGAGVWNTGSTPTIVSSTQITVSMNPGTVTDTISVRVCNSASSCTSGTQSVAVTAAVLTPTVTSISPTTMTADNLQHTLTINGTNFQSGDYVQFYWTQGSGAGAWNTGNTPTIVSSTQISISLNPGTVTDTISVRVCNSASSCTSGTQSIAVTAAVLTPAVTSISPTTMTANGVNQTLTINGTNFQSGDYVQFYWTQGSGAGAWNTGNTPTIVSSTQITVSMNPGTVTDTISVRVCNSASSCTSGAQSVAVTAAVLTPTVTSISPTTMTANGVNQTLTINGTNFQSGDYVQFKWTQGAGAGAWNTGNTPTIINSTQISISMNPGTVTDTISVRVCNSASTCTAGTQSVAVTAAVLTPTVTSISPTTMTANGVSQTLTINGTNFQSGDYVQFYWTQGSGAGAWNTGNSPTIVSSTQITVSMNPGTVTDTISVRVCNSASSCTSGAQSVAVTAAVLTPTVTSISPTTMTANGVSHSLTVNGTNFQSGDYVQFKWTQGTGAGVWNTGNTPTIVSSTQLTVNMNPGTVADTISVRVCNSASTCTSGTQSVAVTP